MFIMSFSALLCAHTLSIESWTDAIVDQFLFEGDKMIDLNAFERQMIPGTLRYVVSCICPRELALCLLMLKETTDTKK